MDTQEKVFNIPGKLDVTWREDGKAIVDTWSSYFISLEDFSSAVLIKGLNYAKERGGVAWIVDSRKAIGAFSKEIQQYINDVIFPAFTNNGIKYFITITSDIYLTKKTVDAYAANVEHNGLRLIEMGSVEEAVNWLKENELK